MTCVAAPSRPSYLRYELASFFWFVCFLIADHFTYFTGRYVGSRPIKLRKSSWKSRSFDVVKRKEKDKVQLLAMFNKT